MRRILTLTALWILFASITHAEVIHTPGIAPGGRNYRIVDVNGKGQFTSIQTAINSITDESASNRYTVFVMPGLYQEQVTLTPWVDLVGASRFTTRILWEGDANGTIILSNQTSVSNILIEGSSNAAHWGIVGSNTSNVHVREVDILGREGVAQASGVKLTGNTWATVFFEHMVIDINGPGSYGMYFEGNAANSQNCDMTLNDVFVDTLSATTGGSIFMKDIFAGRMRSSLLRTATAGFDLRIEETAGNAGITDVMIEMSTLEFGTTSIETTTGSTVLKKCSTVDSIGGTGTVTTFTCN